ncbi:MAG: hypothetical protein HC924_05875 [Synechococcaceae cyanobacterium SM2_3_2]|nr:hypothetical protein [Synechococcaceae cyanobacterium SM2_3_2]
MPQILEVDPVAYVLRFGEQSTQVQDPMAEVLFKSLLTMMPAEKVEKMMPAPTTRGLTLTHISAADFEQLSRLISSINQALGQEVLRAVSRVRDPGEPLQAKILLGEKSVVKWVEQIATGA